MISQFKFCGVFITFVLIVTFSSICQAAWEKNIDGYENIPSHDESTNRITPPKNELKKDSFSNQGYQEQYEKKLFEYEIWRLEYLKCIFWIQKWIAIIFGAILILSLIISLCFMYTRYLKSKNNDEQEIFFSIKDGVFKLRINVYVFIYIIVTMILLYLYIKNIYPIEYQY